MPYQDFRSRANPSRLTVVMDSARFRRSYTSAIGHVLLTGDDADRTDPSKDFYAIKPGTATKEQGESPKAAREWLRGWNDLLCWVCNRRARPMAADVL